MWITLRQHVLLSNRLKSLSVLPLWMCFLCCGQRRILFQILCYLMCLPTEWLLNVHVQQYCLSGSFCENSKRSLHCFARKKWGVGDDFCRFNSLVFRTKGFNSTKEERRYKFSCSMESHKTNACLLACCSTCCFEALCSCRAVILKAENDSLETTNTNVTLQKCPLQKIQIWAVHVSCWLKLALIAFSRKIFRPALFGMLKELQHFHWQESRKKNCWQSFQTSKPFRFQICRFTLQDRIHLHPRLCWPLQWIKEKRLIFGMCAWFDGSNLTHWAVMLEKITHNCALCDKENCVGKLMRGSHFSCSEARVIHMFWRRNHPSACHRDSQWDIAETQVQDEHHKKEISSSKIWGRHLYKNLLQLFSPVWDEQGSA